VQEAMSVARVNGLGVEDGAASNGIRGLGAAARSFHEG
jgi:hypothetical protein